MLQAGYEQPADVDPRDDARDREATMAVRECTKTATETTRTRAMA